MHIVVVKAKSRHYLPLKGYQCFFEKNLDASATTTGSLVPKGLEV